MAFFTIVELAIVGVAAAISRIRGKKASEVINPTGNPIDGGISVEKALKERRSIRKTGRTSH